MSEKENSLKQNLSIAVQGTDEQKRDHNMRMIQDQNRQESIQSMVRYRDSQLKKEQERLERQRDLLAKEITSKKARPPADLILSPSGVKGLPIEEQRRLVRKAVENKYGPEHAQQIAQLRDALNKNIDREIQNARSLEEDRSNIRTADPAVRQASRVRDKIDRMKTNSQDITGKREQSRHLGRRQS
ncbi:MAG: hypothetical protein AAF530_20040 [Pseudomonadota bacterium]